MHIRVCAFGMAALSVAACRPSDVLSVPAPAGVTASSAFQSQSGAEGVLRAARGQLFSELGGGLVMWTGLLSDEMSFAAFNAYYGGANVDARQTAGDVAGEGESGDVPWAAILQARLTLLLALPLLKQYEPAGSQSKIGEAYALVGYAELLLAESYCAGTPLGQILPDGKGVAYGVPLTADSLLGVAQAHFDSAIANAGSDPAIAALAGVGLGRTLLDRAQPARAAAAVTGVPTGFTYNIELEPASVGASGQPFPNVYAACYQFGYSCSFNVADHEGTNGLDFISAHDPRLTYDTSRTTVDGGTMYIPEKFAMNLSIIPLATGIEARLIEAEAALQANDAFTWASKLRTLRADTADTHVAFPPGDSLPPDSAETVGAAAQVDLLFRERAFWLYGTGTRLGDMRRLIRQYGRDPETVFPTGTYVNGTNPHLLAPIPTYGTDVSLTLPTLAGLGSSSLSITNPNYKGCLTSTQTP